MKNCINFYRIYIYINIVILYIYLYNIIAKQLRNTIFLVLDIELYMECQWVTSKLAQFLRENMRKIWFQLRMEKF